MISFDHGGRRWTAEWVLNEASTGFVLRVKPTMRNPLPEKEDVRLARIRAIALLPKPTGTAEPQDMVTGYYRVRREDHWCVARWKPSENCWRFGDDQKLAPGTWDEIGARVA